MNQKIGLRRPAMEMGIHILSALAAALAITPGCTHGPHLYRAAQQVSEAPLGILEHHSFRFLDKWRISHNWLSGPFELRGCHGYPSNSFRRLGGYGDLGYERNSPFIEKENGLYIVSEHKDRWSLSNRRENIYGTNREGKFEGFSPFCVDVFQKDSLDGLGLYIIKPDPAKGTTEWIDGAKPIAINGLQWLHKKIPIQDWSERRERLTAPIEIWVLKIPDTQYWMVLRFSASSGSKYGLGAGAHPEKHQQLLDLFHEIVASVKLEPITPINIDYLFKETQ